ncbi:MAG: chorismate synthase [Marinifilaceae bacterium]
MSGNSIGKLFTLSSFGESHGSAIGGVIDGCPSGILVDIEFIQKELDRRRPGQSPFTTSRKESDQIEILSGVFEGKTTGTSIGFIVRNQDHRSKDYTNISDKYRPSHADYTYDKKYGIRDYRGGGRSSAREHIARVAAGAFAKLVLQQYNITITAYTSQIGDIKINRCDFSQIEENPLRCPDKEALAGMTSLIKQVQEEGDSIGGIVSCTISNVPIGLGEPVFDKLSARLAHAMMGINAAKGFELGSGFSSAVMRGSEHNDVFCKREGKIKTKTNNSGGIQGGISNGEDINFSLAFKPVATISSLQETVDTEGNQTTISVQGRHDPCVVPRAIPVVEAMAAIVILDSILENNAINL